MCVCVWSCIEGEGEHHAAPSSGGTSPSMDDGTVPACRPSPSMDGTVPAGPSWVHDLHVCRRPPTPRDLLGPTGTTHYITVPTLPTKLTVLFPSKLASYPSPSLSYRSLLLRHSLRHSPTSHHSPRTASQRVTPDRQWRAHHQSSTISHKSQTRPVNLLSPRHANRHHHSCQSIAVTLS